jgi:hypothetical protein
VKVKKNLKLHAITLNLTNTGRKNLKFITYSSNWAGLHNFTEIQGGHVNCCVNLTWNKPIHKNFSMSNTPGDVNR